MARRRYISTDISTDAAVNDLSDFGALLYTWMIPHAGDDGGITANPEELKMLVVPGKKRRKTSDVAEAVAAMLAAGLLEMDGHRLCFPAGTFYKYQNYIKTENRRKMPQNAAKPHEMPQNPVSVPIPVPVPVSPPISLSTPLTPLAGGDRVRRRRRRRDEPEPGSLREMALNKAQALKAAVNGGRA